MGKTRKPKTKVKKVNPLGVPSIRELEQLEDEFNLESNPAGPIVAIQEQLESGSTDERVNGLQSLAVISANAEKVKAICSSEIIRIAAPFLVDPNKAVRNATAGALRNLSVCGLEVCENMVDQDVLTPLLALLNEYANDASWTPTFDAAMNNELDINSDTFVQAINLLWNLCESTSLALDNFNQSHILQSFIRCLDYKIFGLEIAVSTAQCLLIISEDNSNSWNILTEFVPQFVCLLNIEESDHPHTFLRTLAAGILSNVPALSAAHSTQILSALSRTLDVNHRSVLGEITSRLPLLHRHKDLTETDANSESNHMEEESNSDASHRRRREELPSEIEIEVKHVGYMLDAQRIASEIISNQCSTGDEEWVDDDNNDASDDESVRDFDTSNSSLNLQNGDKLPVEVLEAIKSLGLVEKLYQRAQPVPDNVQQILRENSYPLLKKLKSLRISTLLCLQNLCNTMNTEDLGGPQSFYGVWLDLGHQVFQGPQDPTILEPSTSLMRAALVHLKNNKELFQQMTESDLQLMLNGVNNCTIAEIRANWLRMLGTLGCLLSEPLVKLIMSFIFETCSREHDVWTLSEAIDALMDMFSDNDWNQIVYELGLVQKSKDLEKVFKSKIRQQKRELLERYPAVVTVRTNFARFIKYLETESKNYTPNGSV